MKTNSIKSNYIKFSAVRDPAQGYYGSFQQTTKVISGDSDLSDLIEAFKEFLTGNGFMLQNLDIRLVDLEDEAASDEHLHELQEKLEMYENLEAEEDDDENEPEKIEEYWERIKKRRHCDSAHACRGNCSGDRDIDIEEVF